MSLMYQHLMFKIFEVKTILNVFLKIAVVAVKPLLGFGGNKYFCLN